ncbi:uncharacterized protein LOC131499193 [Neofelis nebulosa]|uniref:uncharacterized protein LOC131499193 n=1 Tax=Neofelis nebulosa TaxID=61452 RepID=UPI0027296C91|nr:uncharacterized protein LOC131499193 [Neofelis nebulosa]
MGTFVLKARYKVLKSEKNEECNRRVHGRLGFKWEKEGNHASPHLQLCSLPQYSRWGEKEMGIFGSVAHTGESGYSLTCSHFLLWEKLQAKGFFLALFLSPPSRKFSFLPGERACPAPRPALSVHSLVDPEACYCRVPPKPRPHAFRRTRRRRGHCGAGPSRPSPLVRIGTRSKAGAVRVGVHSAVPRSRRERPATAAGALHAQLPRHAASARVRARTRARTCPSFGLGSGDPPGGGWAAEVRGEEPELWRCCRSRRRRRHCRRPREEHVCNSSQESEDGHQIVPRVRPTEVDCTISLKDLRILFLYEFKLGHSAATASRNINSVFGEGSVSERTIRWWFEKFRSGDLSLKNEPRGRPKSVLNEDQLRAMVEANPKMAIRGLAADLGVSATTISRHLAAIGKVKKLDKWHHDPPYLCIRSRFADPDARYS